jgi:hypothetical protein
MSETMSAQNEGIPVKGFIVYAVEHLRDGIEEWARLFDTKEAALAYINKVATGFAGSNCTFRLFTIGTEIPLKKSTVETPRDPITHDQYTT